MLLPAVFRTLQNLRSYYASRPIPVHRSRGAHYSQRDLGGKGKFLPAKICGVPQCGAAFRLLASGGGKRACAACLAQRFAVVDVKMQMLGILILPQIGQHARAAVLSDDLRGDLFDRGDQLQEDGIVTFCEC